MADMGTVAASGVFLTTLTAMIGYMGNSIVGERTRHREAIMDERARTDRAETALAKCQEKCEKEAERRWAAERERDLTELKLARLTIEYGHSDTQRPGAGP